jgi:hypothetical protein
MQTIVIIAYFFQGLHWFLHGKSPGSNSWSIDNGPGHFGSITDGIRMA